MAIPIPRSIGCLCVGSGVRLMGEPECQGPADETEIDFAETFLREPRLVSAEGKASTGPVEERSCELRESQPRKLRLFVHKEHKELHEYEPAAREGKSDQSTQDENVEAAKPPSPKDNGIIPPSVGG